MVKIDLITGFLGSGKTTFIKKYAKYLIDQGENIGILENDYGAVNVDMMLLKDLEGENCELEMTMIGQLVHLRTEEMISLPSISGRPRSKRIRSGHPELIMARAAFPESVVVVLYPLDFNVLDIKSRIFFSSSMIKIE